MIEGGKLSAAQDPSQTVKTLVRNNGKNGKYCDKIAVF